MIRLFSIFTGFGVALLGLGAASAATISVDPPLQPVLPGDSFEIRLEGTDFTAPTLGGDLTLNFNATVIGYVGSSANFTTPWDSLSSVEEIRAGSGILDFSFGTFPATNDVDGLVTLTFTAIDVGSNDFSLEIPQWAGGGIGDVIDVTPVNGAVNVVPIPAAVWLFGSALTGLAFVRRRRRQAGA